MGRTSNLSISVITPVYNAAEFVARAVESALTQPETAEVLLIEDGSPDSSLKVCRDLADKYGKVKLLRHPGGENRGAGASRNLGMQNASCEYIAFLDADDAYLPGRFVHTKEVFTVNQLAEGVYETIKNYGLNETGIKRWQDANRQPDTLTGLKKPVEPDKLAHILITGGYGSLHLDGLTLKKTILQKSGYMNEALRLHQDTDFIIRVAHVARLYAGSLNEPVALRGIHDHNRLTAPLSKAQEYKNRMAYWMSLLRWSQQNEYWEIHQDVLGGIIRYTRSHKYFRKFPTQWFPTRLIWWVRYLRLLHYPELLPCLISHRK